MEFAEQLQEDTLLDRVINDVGTWCYQCDPEAKRQYME
jgi:hypothetical protein